MDILKMMKEAGALQKSLTQAQAELKKIEVKGTASGGLVEVLMNAQGELKSVKIKKEAVDPSDVETLEDLVLCAFNDATKKALSVSKEKLGKLTGGLNLPNL